MVPDDKLRLTVDSCIFLHFEASDGTGNGFNMLEMAREIGPTFNKTLLKWCKDRVDQTPANKLLPETRDKLLTEIDDLMQAKSELRGAAKQSGHVEPISEAWLDESEARAQGAASVALPGDQFRELLAVARNGLRPKAMPQAKSDNPLTVLRELYESEINYSIASFWDGGYHVKLGDVWNGWLAEQIGLMSWEEIAAWLRESAIRHYPDSVFAEKHGEPRPRAADVRLASGSAAGPLAGSEAAKLLHAQFSGDASRDD